MGGDEIMTISADIKPMLFSVADALDMDLGTTDWEITGSRQSVYDLFEGYSPTVVSTITNSLIDESNKVVAVDLQVWGNLGLILVNESQTQTLSLFVYDRARALSKREGLPWAVFWSREMLYSWLETPCKAIYHRSVFEDNWHLLEKGTAKLREYNEARDKETMTAKEAYVAMWGEL